MQYQGTGSEIQLLGLQLAPVWNPGDAGGSLFIVPQPGVSASADRDNSWEFSSRFPASSELCHMTPVPVPSPALPVVVLLHNQWSIKTDSL